MSTADQAIQTEEPNWLIQFANNDGHPAEVSVFADSYDLAISKASKEVSTQPGGLYYFKNAKQLRKE